MSGYPSQHSRDNSDTFLSRVFGLHSIYNQLEDNYQFYDPESDSVVTHGLHQSYTEQPDQDSLLTNELDVKSPNDSAVNQKSGSNSNNLLDSDSDLDLSLSPSESEGPRLAKLAITEPRQRLGRSNIEWNHVQPVGIEDKSIENTYNDEEQDDYLLKSNLSPMKSKKSHFKLPRIFPKFGKNKPSNELPLYNPPIEFRKPNLNKSDQTQTPTTQQLYQRDRKVRSQFVIPPKERALYLWANITNMDEFLTDVYYYYRGKGIGNIITTRFVDLLILIFVLGFSVFLKWGINYNYFFDNYKSNNHITLNDLLIPNFIYHQVPFSVKLLLFGFLNYVILRLIQLYYDCNYKLKELKNFYTHLLSISNDQELLTISWSTIVERLMLLKDYNSLTSDATNTEMHINDLNSKIRLNAHDIANRIMRMENYMIALVNKDVLDLSVNIPIRNKLIPLLDNKLVLTRTLEWNIKLCINNFIFNQHGQINSKVLKEVNRNQLALELSNRFKMAALINLLLCPFIVIYFVLLYFFRYFNEYKANPSSILGLRQYTPFAEWKLREFNELSHFFIRRLHLSIGPANTYINQFPRGFIVVNLMTLVNLILGAMTAVLVLMGLWFEDEDHSFWSFEISEGKSTLFYISILGTIWAITAGSANSPNTGSSSSENINTQTSSFVYDPEASLRYVSQFTRYLPSSWNGRLHTVEVKNEFCEFYSLKIIIILNEILSLILTPFILWHKISRSTGTIIDFFREYSIHVDGLGYICYFAMFNFDEKDKNMMFDLNKKKKKKSRDKSKIYKSSMKKTYNDEIELDPLKPKAKVKIVDNDTRHIEPDMSIHSENTDNDEDDDEEDADDAELTNLYHDEKMIRSYMYFLETYQGSDNQKSQPKRNKVVPGIGTGTSYGKLKLSAIAQSVEPSNSLLVQPPATPSNEDNLSMMGSMYAINYKFEENDTHELEKGKKSGVLGMLNQFYKQDPNR